MPGGRRPAQLGRPTVDRHPDAERAAGRSAADPDLGRAQPGEPSATENSLGAQGPYCEGARVSDLLDEMATARTAWASSSLRSWYSPDQLHAQLSEQLSEEAGWVGDADFGRGFRDALGAPDVPDPLDWANHLVDLPDGWALTHLRFRYGDPSRAFVDVVATTAPPSPDGLLRAAAAALPTHAAFSPLCLRVEVPDAPGLLTDLAADDRFGPCSVAHQVLAGLVCDLRRHPRAAAHPSVRLRPTTPEQAADRAAGIYAELERVEPRISAWARPQDAASLEGPVEQGLLFEVLADGAPAGVVAAGRDDDPTPVPSSARSRAPGSPAPPPARPGRPAPTTPTARAT